MSKPQPKFRKDTSLRFYNEVLGLDRLHYGLWNPEDPRTLEGVKIAQLRYEDYLLQEIRQLFPNPSQTRILDVGCGTGAMTEALHNAGFIAEGLSPDLHQQEVFKKRLQVPFHLARFQYFEASENSYDIILMSESAQYISLPQLFEVAAQLLKPTGILMVCDYFTFNHSSGPLAKSGHKFEKFMPMASQSGFQMIKEQDITAQVAPTLETADLFTKQYILPTVDILMEKFQQKKPRLLRFAKWLFRKNIAKLQNNIALLNAEEFCKNKAYKLIIFKNGKQNPPKQ
ncbi:MAG: class I SAM-dependent methyltransferase [Bacteroidales bacterium]